MVELRKYISNNDDDDDNNNNKFPALNELIYAGAKLVYNKTSVFHKRIRTETQNVDRKFDWKRSRKSTIASKNYNTEGERMNVLGQKGKVEGEFTKTY